MLRSPQNFSGLVVNIEAKHFCNKQRLPFFRVFCKKKKNETGKLSSRELKEKKRLRFLQKENEFKIPFAEKYLQRN